MKNKIEDFTDILFEFAPNWLTIMNWLIVLSFTIVLANQTKTILWGIISYSIMILSFGFYGLHLVALLVPFENAIYPKAKTKRKKIIRTLIIIFLFFCSGMLTMLISQMIAEVTSLN